MIDVVRIRGEHVAGLWLAIDEVARERRFLGGVQGFPIETTRLFARGMLERGMPQFVGLDGLTVAGWCDIDGKSDEGFAHAGQLGMGVRAAWRRHGLGRRLAQAALDAAWDKGFERIGLEVYASNGPAIHLYETLGFVREGRLRNARKLDGAYDDIIEMGLLRSSARLWRPVAYDPAWPAEADALTARLRAALGELAIRIDHVGSTAVPGLAAKDIIDIQITLADIEPETVAAAVAALSMAGFVHRPENNRDHRPPGAAGPNRDWEKGFFRSPPGERNAHIHARAAGRPNQQYALRFRDYLRAAPEAAEAYARIKRELGKYHAHDGEAYTEIKDPAVDLIALLAERWAVGTGWPGLSA